MRSNRRNGSQLATLLPLETAPRSSIANHGQCEFKGIVFMSWRFTGTFLTKFFSGSVSAMSKRSRTKHGMLVTIKRQYNYFTIATVNFTKKEITCKNFLIELDINKSINWAVDDKIISPLDLDSAQFEICRSLDLQKKFKKITLGVQYFFACNEDTLDILQKQFLVPRDRIKLVKARVNVKNYTCECQAYCRNLCVNFDIVHACEFLYTSKGNQLVPRDMKKSTKHKNYSLKIY